MRPELFTVRNRLGLEELPAQNLGDVLLNNGLDAFLAFATKDRVEFLRNLLSDLIAFRRISGKQRCHNCTAVDFGRSLGQVLEEVLETSAPRRIQRDLSS